MGVYFANQQESHVSDRATLHALRDIIFLDATKQLPFRDNAFDYVFSEHMIEHISYRDGMGLLKEIFRILKPGGKLRLATPDLRFLIDLYDTEKTELQQRYVAWAMGAFLTGIQFPNNLSGADLSGVDTFVINNFVRNWGHRFIYDQKTLWNALESHGFHEITRHEPGDSADEDLRGIESHGRRISDDFNRLESIVVEASKPL
jgi:SAM-dependent methyltransferase